MPAGMYPRAAVIERLMAKVDQSGDCWTWTAQRFPNGYASFWLNGRTVVAHRVAYTELVGPIPAGLDLDHLCRNRACVNPAHLEPVTRAENLRRAVPFRRPTATDACLAGHPRTEENTYARKDRQGGRQCRPCAVEAQRRWRRSHAA